MQIRDLAPDEEDKMTTRARIGELGVAIGDLPTGPYNPLNLRPRVRVEASHPRSLIIIKPEVIHETFTL